MFSANSSQVSEDRLYVEDVFSTYLYTGTGSAQTITNGIDLSGKGGMVWSKARTQVYSEGNCIADTLRGAGNDQFTSTNYGYNTGSITSFNSNGFSLSGGIWRNSSGQNYASWTFRKAPKFFDVVTYTGNGVSTGRNISHALGVRPGFIVVKRTDSTSDWAVLASNGTTGYYGGTTSAPFRLNGTGAGIDFGPGAASATTFNVCNLQLAPSTLEFTADFNVNGATYVAYLFAHDTASDGIIQCGSYTTTGNNDINLGWEPQWILEKRANGLSSWHIWDNMRGMSQTNLQELNADLAGAETSFSSGYVKPTATGYNNTYWGSGQTVIYIAIRRGPMRTPTSGTSVFAPFATSLSVDTPITTNFPVDLMISGQRNSNNATDNWAFIDRLRGAIASTNTAGSSQKRMKSASTDAEDSPTYPYAYNWWNTGLVQGYGLAGASQIYYTLRRAPSFFDEVCYTGTGSARTINHNLGVAPELIITKCRSNGTTAWMTYCSALSSPNDKYLFLNQTSAVSTVAGTWKTPTATTFGMDISFTEINNSGFTYVSYLFASCPGVSKVGSYTGNGSSQTINCGFAAGARFVLIKRTDSTGDWYVWDTARGIVSGNDPHLSLNSIAAEVTTDDSVDTDSSGFVVNQLSATNINVSSATYIYLAVA